ncbi:hypothetical protein [Achromobacter xylosoxidans]|uniref:hypothetical protein n=1 Tax=Alcaligenes xylosoxydans xylosoxydans TaxID=85698 RepID=UPI001EEA6B11|nr:hypothetical protein [Achromobacter xylosoxidans]
MEAALVKKPSYRVLLNEDWDLEDLYEYPHALGQCYSFIYCLDSELNPRDQKRIDNAIREYPWRGGYSYVNMYTVLKNQVPARDQPKIQSIQKASPGWLDLLLNINVVQTVAAAVATLAGAAITAVGAYKKCHSMIMTLNAERRKRQVDNLQKSAAEIKALNNLCNELSKLLGFKSLEQLHQKTGDPEVSLKILMAHYRRLSVLAEYTKNGKATLTPRPSNRKHR